jgi:TPR repeat protein
MRLLPRWRKTEEEELQQRVSALQSALDACKGVAQKRSTGVMAAVAVAALVLGVAIGVYRTPIEQAGSELAVAVGAATPNIEAAETAYHSGDLAGALRMARPRAEQGDARAQSLVGLIYYRGRGGVQQDDAEAAKWLALAARGGDAAAQFNLGVMSEEGRGVPQDQAEAGNWYQRAAEQGHAAAQYNLGLWYGKGEGGPPDVVRAHMWLNLAATRFPANDIRREAAVRNRDAVAGRMSPEQLEQAQRMAREWQPKAAQPPR